MKGRLILAAVILIAAVLVGVFYPSLVILWTGSQECQHQFAYLDKSVSFFVPRPLGGCGQVHPIYRAAQSEIERIDIVLGSEQASSEVTRFNTAPAGEEIVMSADTLALLRVARQYHDASDGAFDVTLSPIIDAWSQARQANRLPVLAELAQIRSESDWSCILFTPNGVIKRRAQCRINLHAIAKGYAIDRATYTLLNAGISSGRIEMSGSLRVFGHQDSPYIAEIHDLSDNPQVIASYEIENAASGSSGNPKRFFEIQGQSFSHIIDPRSLQPSVFIAHVTVLASSAMAADAWATALAVLGPEGFEALPEDLGAFMVIKVDGEIEYYCNGTFAQKLVQRPSNLIVIN